MNDIFKNDQIKMIKYLESPEFSEINSSPQLNGGSLIHGRISSEFS